MTTLGVSSCFPPCLRWFLFVVHYFILSLAGPQGSVSSLMPVSQLTYGSEHITVLSQCAFCGFELTNTFASSTLPTEPSVSSLNLGTFFHKKKAHTRQADRLLPTGLRIRYLAPCLSIPGIPKAPLPEGHRSVRQNLF